MSPSKMNILGLQKFFGVSSLEASHYCGRIHDIGQLRKGLATFARKSGSVCRTCACGGAGLVSVPAKKLGLP